MKKFLILTLIVLSVLLLTQAGYCFEKYPRIMRYEKLKSWIDRGSLGRDFILVDTLSPIEYAAGTIPGAINISMSIFKQEAETLLPDKNKTVVFFCRGLKCHKSHTTAFLAKKMGYTDIWVYESGTPNWVMHGNELEGVHFEEFPEFISSSELNNILKEGGAVFLLDVQDPKGHNKIHIKGAVSIPLFVLHKRYKEISINANIVVYDKAAKQSVTPAQFLMSKGFKNVRCLSGGVLHWQASGFPVESTE